MKNSHVSNTNWNSVTVGDLSTCGHQTLNKSFAVTMTSQMMEYERLAFRFCRVTRSVYQLIRIDTFRQLCSVCPMYPCTNAVEITWCDAKQASGDDGAYRDRSSKTPVLSNDRRTVLSNDRRTVLSNDRCLY
jgi:hypothetical protein